MGFCRRLLDFWRVLRASFATPRRLAGDRSTHWTYVVLFALMLTVPFFLEVSPTGHVHVEMAGKRLPPLCLSKALFRVDCPGCGLTRSFALATHLRFIESLRMHRVGLLLYAFFAIQMVVRILALRRHPALETRWFRSANYHATVTMILLLLGNWILGFFCGGNGL
jgi:hypothetical protein